MRILNLKNILNSSAEHNSDILKKISNFAN